MARTDKDQLLDQWLVVRSRLGDREAMEQLIRRWEPRLLFFVRRLTESDTDAHDIVQQTWVKVLRRIDRLREPKSLAAWLYRIARTTALNHARTGRRYAIALAAEPPSGAPLHDQPIDNLDNADAVHWGLGRLSLPHREVLTLYFLEDLPVQQMSEVLRIPPGTVKSRLFHAKAALRAVLESEVACHA